MQWYGFRWGSILFRDSSESCDTKVSNGDYVQESQEALALSDSSEGQRTVLVGNVKPDYSEFLVPAGDVINVFYVRNGCWIDGIGFETNRETASPAYGNSTGGNLSILEVPDSHFKIVGMYSYTGAWIEGLGIIYVKN